MGQTLRAGAHHRGTTAVYCVKGLSICALLQRSWKESAACSNAGSRRST